MGLILVGLEIDCRDPHRLVDFWARLLARTPDLSRQCLPGVAETDFELRFVPNQTPKSGLHRMHLDLTSTSRFDQQRSVDLGLRLGGTHLDVGQRGDEGHVVLADPEGNEFCVIEAGNRFLADTARIGAVAGDGSRDVGYFWAEALGWPLVWDQNGETAIQHPDGGTKITWGGTPAQHKTARNRLRWTLLAGQSGATEVDRLAALGASVVLTERGRVELVDPEGNEFTVATIDERDGSRHRRTR